MRVNGLFEITSEDVVLRSRHPTAQWVITWIDDVSKITTAFAYVRERVEQTSPQRAFYMRDMFTYVAFEDYDDAALAILAL